MPHYKLHRCAVCKKFNASMLATDGKTYICYSCWYTSWKSSQGEKQFDVESKQSKPGVHEQDVKPEIPE